MEEYVRQHITSFGEKQVETLFCMFAKDRLLFDGKDWWIFVKYAWRQDEESIHMIWTLFKSHHFSTLIWKAWNELDQQQQSSTLRQLETVIRDVEKRKRYIYKVLKASENELLHTSFLQKIDQNIHLVHFLNGVYDLQTHQFRATSPDDYNTITTKYAYRKEGTSDKSKLLNYLTELVGPEQISHLIDALRTILFRTNNRICYEFIGTTSSGRSTFLDLLCVVFGDYFQNLSCARLPGSNTIMNTLNNKGVRCILIEMFAQYPVLNHEKTLSLINRESANGYEPCYTLLFDCRLGNEPSLPAETEIRKIYFINTFVQSSFRQEWKALEFRDELIQLILSE